MGTCSRSWASQPVISPSATTNPSPVPSDLPDLTPDEIKETIRLLKACDSTLSDCQKANRDKAELIKDQQKQLDEQATSIENLKKDSNSLINSKTLWFGIGAIFTGLLVFLVKSSSR